MVVAAGVGLLGMDDGGRLGRSGDGLDLGLDGAVTVSVLDGVVTVSVLVTVVEVIGVVLGSVVSDWSVRVIVGVVTAPLALGTVPALALVSLLAIVWPPPEPQPAIAATATAAAGATSPRQMSCPRMGGASLTGMTASSSNSGDRRGLPGGRVPPMDDRPIKALIGVRGAIGAGAWLAPRFSGRLFGLDPEANPQASYLGRLFGVRDAALAFGLGAARAAARQRVLWLQLGVACDFADAAGRRPGRLPARALAGERAAWCRDGTLVAAGLGVTALRGEQPPA